MWKCLIAFTAALIAASSSVAQDVGQKFSDHLALSTNVQKELYVPLPDGMWVVTNTPDASSRNQAKLVSTPMKRIVLAKKDKDKLAGLILIYYNLEVPTYGWKVGGACESKKGFYRLPEKSTYMDPLQGYHCMNLGLTRFRTKGSKLLKNLDDWVLANSLEVPRIMVKAHYTLSDTLLLLNVRYYSNPEVENLSTQRLSDWAISKWQVHDLPDDKKRQEYLNKIKAWALATKLKIEAGAKGRKSR